MRAGKKGKCPKCKDVVTVPKLQAADTAESRLNNSERSSNKVNIEQYIYSEVEKPREPEPQKQNKPIEPANTDFFQDPRYAQHLPGEHEISIKQDKDISKRKLPWLIDVLSYPANASGLTILGIVIIIPFLINLMADLVGPFWPFITYPGIFIKIVIALYAFWYFIECIRDSAEGGIRAPETIATTPALGEMFLAWLKIIAVLGFFAAPAVVYYNMTEQHNMLILYSLVIYGIIFTPLALLAVIMFDTFSALNPILLIGSMLSTVFQYGALILLLTAIVYLNYAIMQYIQAPFFLNLIRFYLSMVTAHLIGRFFWRYQDKLRWEV